MRRLCASCRTTTFDDTVQTCRACGRSLEPPEPRDTARQSLLSDRTGVRFGPPPTPAPLVAGARGSGGSGSNDSGSNANGSDVPGDGDPSSGDPSNGDPGNIDPGTDHRDRGRSGGDVAADEAGRRRSPSRSVRAKLRNNSPLFGAIIVAGLGWGVVIGGLTPREQRPPAAAVAPQVDPNVLAGKLQLRNDELTALTAQYNAQQAELGAARRALARRPAPGATAAPRSGVASAARRQGGEPAAALVAEESKLTQRTRENRTLLQQLAGLRSENAGLERNYNDLLDALHRSQNVVFFAQGRLTADARAARLATCAPTRTRRQQ